jgi:hypothetical protein
MPMFIGLVDVTHNRRLNLASAMNEHAHPMPRRLVARTVVGQDKRKIDRMFVCICQKIPLLLRLVMDFVGTGAEAAELKGVVNATSSGNGSPTHMFWKVVSRGMRRRLFTGKGC